MGVSPASEPSIYYKESNFPAKSARFCLKPVYPGGQRAEKKSDGINVQVVKGKTTTFIHLEEDEAKKVQAHGDLVLKKLQRIHKSVIWNVLIGRVVNFSHPRARREVNCEKFSREKLGARNARNF